MATESVVKVSPDLRPVFASGTLTEASAQKVSELLNENHRRFHIFFNRAGFHNHIVHHLLTNYALGASPATLQKNYDDNTGYQQPARSLKDKDAVIEDLQDPAVFIKNLGPNTGLTYTKYLKYFQSELARKGWKKVLDEYLFAEDTRAQEMLARLFAGFLHPIIHLGFGIEFEQPVIIAEALAQAAAHNSKLKPFFLQSEQKARELKQSGRQPKSLVQLLHELQASASGQPSTSLDHGGPSDEVIPNDASERMVYYASQFFVRDESELEKRTAEMIHLCAYYASAAQRQDKLPKFDFFYIHALNCSIFFTKIIKLPNLSTSNKVRLLEWKARVDLELYTDGHSAQLLPDIIRTYKPSANYPSQPDDMWKTIFEQATTMDDDAHTPKLIRALAHAKEACASFEHDESLEFVIRGDMWDRLGQMAIESVSSGGPTWVRGAGSAAAWSSVPARQTRL